MKLIKGCIYAALAMCAFATSAEAAVLRVVVVETSDVAAYTAELGKIRAGIARIGGKETLRFWRARFAGPNAGQLVVSIEYADMATYAAEDAKMRADADLSATLKGLDKIRKVVSDSIYDEVK